MNRFGFPLRLLLLLLPLGFWSTGAAELTPASGNADLQLPARSQSLSSRKFRLSPDGTIHAIDESGRLSWSFSSSLVVEPLNWDQNEQVQEELHEQLKELISRGSWFSDDRQVMFMGSSLKSVFVIDPNTGTLIYKFDVNGSTFNDEARALLDSKLDGIQPIFFERTDHSLQCFEISTGAIKWSVRFAEIASMNEEAEAVNGSSNALVENKPLVDTLQGDCNHKDNNSFPISEFSSSHKWGGFCEVLDDNKSRIDIKAFGLRDKRKEPYYLIKFLFGFVADLGGFVTDLRVSFHTHKTLVLKLCINQNEVFVSWAVILLALGIVLCRIPRLIAISPARHLLTSIVVCVFKLLTGVAAMDSAGGQELEGASWTSRFSEDARSHPAQFTLRVIGSCTTTWINSEPIYLHHIRGSPWFLRRFKLLELVTMVLSTVFFFENSDDPVDAVLNGILLSTQALNLLLYTLFENVYPLLLSKKTRPLRVTVYHAIIGSVLVVGAIFALSLPAQAFARGQVFRDGQTRFSWPWGLIFGVVTGISVEFKSKRILLVTLLDTGLWIIESRLDKDDFKFAYYVSFLVSCFVLFVTRATTPRRTLDKKVEAIKHRFFQQPTHGVEIHDLPIMVNNPSQETREILEEHGFYPFRGATHIVQRVQNPLPRFANEQNVDENDEQNLDDEQHRECMGLIGRVDNGGESLSAFQAVSYLLDECQS